MGMFSFITKPFKKAAKFMGDPLTMGAYEYYKRNNKSINKGAQTIFKQNVVPGFLASLQGTKALIDGSKGGGNFARNVMTDYGARIINDDGSTADRRLGNQMTEAAKNAQAQIAEAEYAATAKEGLERLAGKRRRSFASTMIASNNLGSPTVLG